jgi:hypothetical protein
MPMHKHVLSLVALSVTASFLTAACGGDEAQDPSDVQPGQYGQPGQPGQYGQPGYGQPQPGYTAPPPAQTAPAAGAASPLALPCQSDGGICGTHKCNLTTQKCSFPCAAPTDCMAGFTCMAGVCLPGSQ